MSWNGNPNRVLFRLFVNVILWLLLSEALILDYRKYISSVILEAYVSVQGEMPDTSLD